MLAVVSCWGETQCAGNGHNVSSMRVAEFDFLTENLDSGWLTCAYSLSLSHCVLNVISRCKFCKNGFFNTFFPLSHTFYFETRPSPLSKIKENAFGAHFLQLYRKNEYGDPHFLFHDFNKDSASFRWEKNWHKSMFSFLAILLNCTDWAITGRIARIQFNSTLECKVKTRALKGIFLERKRISNTLKSNSKFCALPHASLKKSLLFV